MSYHWKCCKNIKPYIGCHYYALIDKSGEAKLCVYGIYPNYGVNYLNIKIDKSIIQNVVQSSDQFLKDPNMDYKNLTKYMMDQASIKIRINYPQLNKTINFINEDEISGIHIFMKLFHYIDSLYMSGKYVILNDTLNLAKRRDEFIKYSMRIDTTLIPPPPPPSEEYIEIK